MIMDRDFLPRFAYVYRADSEEKSGNHCINGSTAIEFSSFGEDKP